jgi:RNA-directed DNA polymerase
MEGRGQPEGSPREKARVRTQSRVALPPNLERVNTAAKQAAQTRFTALLHHVDEDALRRAFRRQKRQASAGVDGITVAKYEERLTDNLRELCGRVHTGRYRPQPVRRVYIPKADGGKRPLGVPALEDKIVQSAVAEVLSSVYEVDFLGFSYGFRPGRNPHMALDALHTAIMSQRVNWVLDADIRNFFDSVDHEWLLRMVAHRIADPRILRLIELWLRARVLESGEKQETDRVPRRGRASVRSSPTSFCTTSSISGSTNGAVAAHAVALWPFAMRTTSSWASRARWMRRRCSWPSRRGWPALA